MIRWGRATGICIAILCSAAAGRAETGPTFNLDHSIHYDLVSVPEYIEDPVPAALINAVPLLTEDQGRCGGDATACLSFTTTQMPNFGSPGDGHLDITDSLVAVQVMTSTSYPIKVVRSLFWNGRFKGGATLEGFFNCIMAYDSPGKLYGHEFGHMVQLDPRDDCADAVMWETTSGAHDALTIDEATQISLARDACCVTPGTADCAPKGVAAIQNISAIPGPLGVEAGFSTLWEANTASFEVTRVDEVTGALRRAYSFNSSGTLSAPIVSLRRDRIARGPLPRVWRGHCKGNVRV